MRGQGRQLLTRSMANCKRTGKEVFLTTIGLVIPTRRLLTTRKSLTATTISARSSFPHPHAQIRRVKLRHSTYRRQCSTQLVNLVKPGSKNCASSYLDNTESMASLIRYSPNMQWGLGLLRHAPDVWWPSDGGYSLSLSKCAHDVFRFADCICKRTGFQWRLGT